MAAPSANEAPDNLVVGLVSGILIVVGAMALSTFVYGTAAVLVTLIAAVGGSLTTIAAALLCDTRTPDPKD